MSQAIPLFISKPGDSIAGFFYIGSDIFVSQRSRTSDTSTAFEAARSYDCWRKSRECKSCRCRGPVYSHGWV